MLIYRWVYTTLICCINLDPVFVCVCVCVFHIHVYVIVWRVHYSSSTPLGVHIRRQSPAFGSVWNYNLRSWRVGGGMNGSEEREAQGMA